VKSVSARRGYSWHIDCSIAKARRKNTSRKKPIKLT
jgi:hypothetical protein